MQLGPPEPLAAAHRLDDFECGEAVIDEWIKRGALSNQASGASRTFVVTDEGSRVYGFYAMAAGAVSHRLATSGVRRNMPDPVPVMVLARLAVDRGAQGLHLGAALLQDAVHRAVAVSENAGIRALLVHALHEKARQFYERYGSRNARLSRMQLGPFWSVRFTGARPLPLAIASPAANRRAESRQRGFASCRVP